MAIAGSVLFMVKKSRHGLFVAGPLALLAVLVSPSSSSALQAAATSQSSVQKESSVQNLSSDPRALYQALNALRPDGEHVYTIHELNLRRDVVNVRLIEGKLAFFQAIDGHVTGAVFAGRGHIFATPRERGERYSIAQFLGVPMVNQDFTRAYLRFTDDTASEIRQQLGSETSEAADTKFAESWAGLVSSLNPWHSLRVMLDLLSADPLPYFYIGVENDNIGAFDVLVDARRHEQVLMGQPRIENGMRFYNTWASFKALDAPKTPIEMFAPIDYAVDTTIENDLSLAGRTTLHLKALRAGERVVGLELSRNLAVEGVRLEDGAPLFYFQNEDMSRHDILERGNDALLITLPAPVKAGEEIRLEVKYRGNVISNAGNGVEFVGERGTWYAHVGGGDHFALFDLTFRWPKRLTLVATGARTDLHDDGDVKAGRWQSRVPFAVAGFNLGEYKTETAAGDHPTVELYANQQLENAILALLQKNPGDNTSLPGMFQSPRQRGLSETIPEAPTPSPAAVLKRLGGEFTDSVRFFERLNGPFPFDHLDVSQIPGSFGQGWPGLLYLSTLVFLPQSAQERAGFSVLAQEEARELIPFHEVAHQWWGNVAGSAEYRDGWIQEGMANYLALMYADSKRPADQRLKNWLDRYRIALTTKNPGSSLTPDSAGPLNFGWRLLSSKAPNAYETVTYGKGAWVIHMLREMLADPTASDPDGRFRELLKTILSEHYFAPLSTADFQRAIEKRMTPAMDLEGTRSMDWFFDQWVRSTGIPRYSVVFQVKPHEREFLVTGKLVQSGVDEVFTEPVPLYGTRPGPGGKMEKLGVVVTNGTETRFRFIAKSRPAKILIDPRNAVLCLTN
ncbi:MAG: M1 family aminopeptidase [Candidatus Acidiferrales bacterium]